jgi:hypothetical protein
MKCIAVLKRHLSKINKRIKHSSLSLDTFFLEKKVIKAKDQ